MKKSQLELALRAAGEISHDWDFIVFGSQCILGTIAAPPRVCLVSQELDLYPRNYPQAVPLLVAKLGRRSPFSRAQGFFVDSVSPDLAAIPGGWTDRLIPFCTKRTGGVTGWCLELYDLAASKLAAGRQKDLIYVSALLQRSLIQPVVLENRLAILPVSARRREALASLLKRLVAELRAKRRAARRKK